VTATGEVGSEVGSTISFHILAGSGRRVLAGRRKMPYKREGFSVFIGCRGFAESGDYSMRPVPENWMR